MKKDIGFRFSEETHTDLLGLSDRWGCTRTEVIEALVREAVRAVDVESAAEKVLRDPSRSKRAHVEQAKSLTQKVASPKVLPKDPKEVAKVVAAPKNPKVKPVMQVLTREEREARMAAAQGWLAKGKK